MSRKNLAATKAYQARYKAEHREEYRQYHKAYRQTEKYRSSRNRYWLKLQYGMTPEDYKDRLVEQRFSCAVCKVEQSRLKRKLVVDHDHKTGKVRGLLCNPCNNKRVDTVENFGYLIPVILEYLKRGI